MDQFIPILLGALILSFPIILFQLYLTALKKRSEKIIQDYTSESSIVYKDLTVWIKNFDVYRKRNLFNLDPFQTIYDYNDCDLILNGENFLVIGKVLILGRWKPIIPTIFEFKNDRRLLSQRHVFIENILEIGDDLEIEFTDNKYLDSTLR